MSKSKERCILPGLLYEEKPGKNFLLENIKKLREIQRETQKKLASQNQPNYYSNYKKVPDMKIRSYQKRNKSEADLGVDSENPSLKSRLSTPVTAMASPKPVKNQKMQTVATEKVNRGKVIQARGPAMPPVNKTEKKLVGKVPSMVRSASVPSFSVDESEANSDAQDQAIIETSTKKLNQEMLEKLINGEKKDFVTYNTYRTYEEKTRPKKPDPIKPPPNYRMGEVPKYLHSTSKKDLVSISGGSGDADLTNGKCPGYIMLSDRERKDHLEEFKKAYSELICKLRNIPLSSDSYSNRQRKMQIEKELEKLEDLMKLFSRGRLYIKV